MARTVGLFVWLAVSFVALPRALALTQPNGTVIPTGASQLGPLFSSRGEAISAQADAAILPETFTPACALTFTVLQRLADNKNAFGWYNVTGAAPTNTQLHEVLSCTDAVGTSRTVDIRNSPAYAGGQIGFYEATGSCATSTNHTFLFFSQRALNPDGAGSGATIHLLTYDSTVTPRAFYFGWEDLLAGGDNDFDDLTTFVTGITCTGGGGPCETGRPGICAEGTRQCQNGGLTCVQTNAEASEVCDGLDNDCDGVIDDDATCPGNQVCDRGHCVPRCGSVEFPCAGADVCTAAGLCVEPTCVDVDCPPGQRCEGGSCVEPCRDVTCPFGQVCRVGACVDPCASLHCDANQVCVAGVCQDRCQCSGCGAGDTCDGTSGLCEASACTSVTCPPDQYCADDGSCVDRCAGASCPDDQVCEHGACVPAPPPPDAGPHPLPPDAAPPDASVADAGAGTDGGDGSRPAPGCGCRAGGNASPSAALLLLGVLLVFRRRRR
jgi:MYXO-CTERM domain-containing protein